MPRSDSHLNRTLAGRTLPITISVLYRTYEAAFREGRRPSLGGAICPRSGCGGLAEWTQSTVERGMALLEPDGFEVMTVVRLSGQIGLARCSPCSGRFRVLPGDVVLGKTYSLPIIEHAASRYVDGAQSLREVVRALPGERVPAHTTLHGWTEGLGAYVLGRAAGEIPGSAPMSRLWAETESHQRELTEALRDARREKPFVDPRRYESEGRCDRLGEVAVALRVAGLSSGVGHPMSLTAWRVLALGWTTSCLLLFRSQISCTRIEQVAPQIGRRSSPTERSQDQWPTPTRSPPGDSTR